MKLFDHHGLSYAAIALFFCICALADTQASPTITSTATSSHVKPTPPPLNATCESRTINYITHSLASICLRHTRTQIRSDSSSTTSSLPIEENTTSQAQVATPSAAAEVGSTPEVDIDPDSALDDASFLSFEEWKKQTLEKEGIEAASADRRIPSGKDGDKRRRADSLEDLAEGEDVNLDFSGFLGERPREPASTRSKEDPIPTKESQEPTGGDEAEKPRYRSKDAGKTCKERFNFASLDAGGQVMKSNPEAKSVSAVLKEDRDVYMLNNCQAKNKFFIIELSESILVETIALANFEFFSSTFRQFRVSVSDKYPVKLDRWTEIGVFEARNSREIQAFLVKDPRIWARYLRIEFLSHFGNEFYCPVSLLRVHGRTMIQDVLSMEQGAGGEDDGDDEQEGLNEGQGEILVPEAVAEILKEEENVVEGLKEAQAAIENLMKTAEEVAFGKLNDSLASSHITEVNQWLENATTEQLITPWNKDEQQSLQSIFNNRDGREVCLPSESPKATSNEAKNKTVILEGAGDIHDLSNPPNATCTTAPPQTALSMEVSEMSIVNITSMLTSAEAPSQAPLSTVSATVSLTSVSASLPSKVQNATSVTAQKSSSTGTSHVPQPTTQESFFKNVSKRLQLLEANSTLSLKYIEEQSKILREAFTKVEKKQLTKITSFIESLNSTVLEELREFSKQYDQIWQSTVMELETQRDLSQRETAAITARLNILADEVVFQKRMSIIQSVLLLLCLAVVIFSRSLSGRYLEVPIIQNMIRNTLNTSNNYPYPSSPDTPESPSAWASPEANQWSGSDHRRQRSDESIHTMGSRSPDESPPTPYSNFSRQDEEEHVSDGGRGYLEEGEQVRLMKPSLVRNGSSGYNPDLEFPQWTDGASSPEENARTRRPFIYPDSRRTPTFRGSSTPEPSNTAQILAQIQRTVQHDSPGLNRHDTFGFTGHNTRDASMDADQVAIAVSPPSPPSSPPRVRESHEFSIARKPLPALPNDDN